MRTPHPDSARRFPHFIITSMSPINYTHQSPNKPLGRFILSNGLQVSVNHDIVSARAYITGLGYYQLYIDGKRIGTSRLDPGWTTFDRTVLYAVYDVTAELQSVSDRSSNDRNMHAFGVELGNGWWNPLPLKMWGHVDVRNALTGKLISPNDTRLSRRSTACVRAKLLIANVLGSPARSGRRAVDRADVSSQGSRHHGGRRATYRAHQQHQYVLLIE